MTDMITMDGITQPIVEWALDYGIYPAVITDRLAHGWAVERAITTPMIVAQGQRLSLTHLPNLAKYGCTPDRPRIRRSHTKQGKRLTFDGRCLTVREWSAVVGVSSHTIHHRIRAGLPIDQVLGPALPGGRKPGVVKNFDALKGTGGGSTAQDISEIEFLQ